ncbi:S41 family peptidase [Kamptonema cortianum]|uniref:S41 family peptidase n=1 Tax=Geitlerinema calcuttense NRMC-F 0142 TaxID=2922238 RepID=A0ABT7LX47_9CYAN|nr:MULTISPECIES: S41 family peptidase [Cyanophyceae]MDK3156625.1 S41 family peptidase [Kamptonema cortianum]MDL5050365.1 S41 family peptidase [Oscillatoria amoena NRMC-F 0135]MDL5053364.1 S41 family peptidase [Oscillatoria laete-virens NRMC-F 0139]MDL5056583.1 S41 family peptidase [Geitlerinema calcuttense NRMC-F 0142]
MMKWTRITFAIVALTAVNLFLGFKLNLISAVEDSSAQKDDSYANIRLFTRVLETVRQGYVDGNKVTYQDLIYSALQGMLSSLDPHSQFMAPETFSDMRDSVQGEFGGVGIVISVRDNAIVIVSPMEDSPGSRAGLMPGDRIVKIDGKTTENMQLGDVVKKLRGNPGEKVSITVFHPKSKEMQEYDLTREIIKVDSVKDMNGKKEFPLTEDKIGYIRVTQFNDPTDKEFSTALDKLEKQGMQGLIIDLRNNPGGLLDKAVDICSAFIPAEQTVVSTEGRDGSNRQVYKSKGGKKRADYPVAVLINGGSASASEIVAGCLQDLKRAIVVGETSFGKGSVQSVLPNEDGSAIRLTTAKYYTPNRRVIHENGVTPDIIVPVTEQEERELILSRMPSFEENAPASPRKKPTDTQLERAKDVIRGIQIFANRANAHAPVAGSPSSPPPTANK